MGTKILGLGFEWNLFWKKQKGNLILLVAAIIGGVGFVAMKNILDSGFTPMQAVAGRYTVAVVMLVIFFFKELKRITKKELEGGILMGILLFFLFVMLMEGLKRTTPSVNAFLGCTTAVVVPIILWIVNKKRPDSYVLIGAVMTGVGVALLSLNDGFEISLGAVLSFGGSVMFAMQMVVMDKYVANCDPARLTLVESTVVMVLAIFAVLLSKDTIPNPSGYDIAMFLISGIFCTFIYFLFQSIGQKYTSPTNASIIITSEAIFAAIASALLYGEEIGIRLFIGGILIFVAVIISEKKPEIRHKKLLTNEEK